MAMAAPFPPEPLAAVAAEMAGLLESRKETISVAETAAGGLISAALLAQPGASGYYKGGLTLYTLESRIAFTGWSQENIKNYKGPTPEIVSGLAENVRETLGTTYTVCESGTAGPTGGGNTRNRTPGYVALAVATDRGTSSKEMDTGWAGDRNANMVAFATEALKLVGSVMQEEAKM